jgi:tetratricopeptide (TPR) repeat protein
MPSRRSPRRRPLCLPLFRAGAGSIAEARSWRTVRGTAGRRFAAALLLAALGIAAGCTTTAGGPPPARPQLPPETAAAEVIRHERAYLADPFEGYTAPVDAARRDRVERAWRDLVDASSLAAARQTAAELIAAAPDFTPAKVLAAQVDFAQGDHRAVVGRLLPVGDAQPNYTASQLLLGRAAELQGDLPLAYAAFRAIATRSAKAFERTGELHSRALEEVGRRLQAALRGGQLDVAGKQLALLQAWAPNEEVTLTGARDLAVARRDRKAELAAVKGLSARRPGDRQLLERRADLELEIGDPGEGLKIIQDMAERHPRDAELSARLAAAKFRWRLSLLPQEVQEMADESALTRAQLAVLLYWLVPEVRYSRPGAGRIATDVLDHLHREEIVRIVNLGLMDVDPTLHRFSPEAEAKRGQGLRSLIRLLAGFGKGVACLREESGSPASVCDTAAHCGLVDSLEACEAGEPLSGADAVDFIRRGVHLLGGV